MKIYVSDVGGIKILVAGTFAAPVGQIVSFDLDSSYGTRSKVDLRLANGDVKHFHDASADALREFIASGQLDAKPSQAEPAEKEVESRSDWPHLRRFRSRIKEDRSNWTQEERLRTDRISKEIARVNGMESTVAYKTLVETAIALFGIVDDVSEIPPNIHYPDLIEKYIARGNVKKDGDW